MKLVLERDVFSPDFTLGKLNVNNIRQLYTCEDETREIKGVPVAEWKVAGETAIPVGTYKVIINKSNRFKKLMPLVLNVPNFEGIRIHPGNSNHDTEGCILVGKTRSKDYISKSRKAYEILFAKMKLAKEITLTIS